MRTRASALKIRHRISSPRVLRAGFTFLSSLRPQFSCNLFIINMLHLNEAVCRRLSTIYVKNEFLEGSLCMDQTSRLCIVFVIATLALLSVLGVTFVSSAAIDQSWRVAFASAPSWLQKAASNALAALQALPADPCRRTGRQRLPPTRATGWPGGNGVFTTFSLRVTDESSGC